MGPAEPRGRLMVAPGHISWERDRPRRRCPTNSKPSGPASSGTASSPSLADGASRTGPTVHRPPRSGSEPRAPARQRAGAVEDALSRLEVEAAHVHAVGIQQPLERRLSTRTARFSKTSSLATAPSVLVRDALRRGQGFRRIVPQPFSRSFFGCAGTALSRGCLIARDRSAWRQNLRLVAGCQS